MSWPLTFDRVLEVSTFTGTGNIILSGAPAGYLSFASQVGIGNRMYYCVECPDTFQWEIGIGTLVNSVTISRDMIVNTSVIGNLNAVSFAAGNKNVFIDIPADLINKMRDYIYIQASPQNTWNINHNLNKYPQVILLDNSGNKLEPDVNYPDENNIVISLAYALAGKAILK